MSLQLAEQRALAEVQLAAAEGAMLEASGDVFQFERARTELAAVRNELDRLSWAERRAARDAEQAVIDGHRRRVEQAVTDGTAAVARAAGLMVEFAELTEQLAAIAKQLRSLNTTVSGAFSIQVWGASHGHLARAAHGSSVPIEQEVLTRLFQVAAILAKISGTSLTTAATRAAQAREI